LKQLEFGKIAGVKVMQEFLASARHPQTNKQFIGQLDEGQFEIVHPFQMRERNKERISIDTHNYFLNASIHYKHIVIVIKTNVVLNEKIRLKLLLNLNEHLFYNATQFERVCFLDTVLNIVSS
jgi:hypothetical protein